MTFHVALKRAAATKSLVVGHVGGVHADKSRSFQILWEHVSIEYMSETFLRPFAATRASVDAELAHLAAYRSTP